MPVLSIFSDLKNRLLYIIPRAFVIYDSVGLVIKNLIDYSMVDLIGILIDCFKLLMFLLLFLIILMLFVIHTINDPYLMGIQIFLI